MRCERCGSRWARTVEAWPMSQHDLPALAALALGALEEDEARAVRDHVSGCAECRAELGRLRETATRLDHVPPEYFFEGPPRGRRRLLRRILRAARMVAPSHRRNV